MKKRYIPPSHRQCSTGFFGHRQLPSCRHGLPASRPAGCVRTHPCQPGFRQSMPERRTRIVMFTQLAQEVAKATKSGGFETRPYIFLRPLHLRLNFSCFVRCALLCLKIFAACANSTDGLCPLVTRLGLCSRQGAKNAKSGFIFFLCGLCGFARNILAFPADLRSKKEINLMKQKKGK